MLNNQFCFFFSLYGNSNEWVCMRYVYFKLIKNSYILQKFNYT